MIKKTMSRWVSNIWKMIKWYFCSLHKFEFGSEINTEDIDNINYLFVYQNNLNIIKKLNIKFDVNIEKLIHYLEQGMIDFIFVFYDKYNFMHWVVEMYKAYI